ncbi:MAG: TolC family protein [Treponema sp.]|nr:TolC family protein [Treponema sp.]
MKRFLSVLCVALFLGAFLSAEDLTLSVEQAVELAMQNNISVKQAERTLKSAERADKYSWNSVSPSISASGNLSIPLMENAQTKSQDMSVSVSGSASIRLSPSLYTSIRSAKLDLEQGLITYEEACRSVELNVRKIFYSILLSEENIATQKRSMEAAKRQYETNREKFNRGQLSELDLLQSQVNYESKMPSIESQENQLINSMENFKQLLGVNREIHLILSGSLKEIESFDGKSVDFNISKIPSVIKIEKQVEAQENRLMATRFSAWGPTLSASYSIGAGQTLKEGQEFKLQNHSLSIGVSIPLDGYLPWSSGAMSIENQKDSLASLKDNLENTKTTVQLSIENSLRTIRQAQSQKKSLESTVSLAQKTYDMVQTAYNHGSKDLNSLKNAEDSLINAKSQLLNQDYTLVTAILELENILGVPFGSLSK